MSRPASILVAHSSEEERVRLEAALYEAGYEVTVAEDGEQALRSTAGLNPTVVVAEAGLAGIPAVEIFSRLQATGLSVPPFLVLYHDPAQLPEQPANGALYFTSTEGLTPEQVVHQVRLLLLAGDVEGEFGESLEVMHGDLTRTSYSDILQALLKHVFTGRLSFKLTHEAGLWLRDGEVIDAWWGLARGRKAFNRLAALPSGAFSLSLEEPEVERVIDCDLPTLITDAVDERLGVDDCLAELPSLDFRPEVRVSQDFFKIKFSPVEQQTITHAQKAATFGELIDRVQAPDIEVLNAVNMLRERGVLILKEPVGRIHVFTDSTADILPAEARRMGISVLGVSIIFGSEVFKDGLDMMPDDFHRKLREAATLPATNPVTKGEFLEAYRRAISGGDILSIHCSARLSKSFNNAAAAVEEGMDELREVRRQAQVATEPTIITMDGGQASGPLGMLVLFAARLVRKGLKVRDAAARIQEMIPRVHTLLQVSSIDFLRRTGEIKEKPAAHSKGVRPILAVDKGELKVVEQAPSSSHAHRRMVELLADKVDPARPLFVSLVHSAAPAGAAELRLLLHQRFKITELMEHQIGPAVTCHTGPGAVGAGIFQPTDDELDLLRVD
jgi:DegV family protein with EDD domain